MYTCMHVCTMHIDTNNLDNIPSIVYLVAIFNLYFIMFMSVTPEIFVLKLLILNTFVYLDYGCAH